METNDSDAPPRRGRKPLEPVDPTPEWREQRRREGKVPMTKAEIRDIVRYVVKKQFDPVVKRVCRLYIAGYWHEDVCRLARIDRDELERIRARLAQDFADAGVHLRRA